MDWTGLATLVAASAAAVLSAASLLLSGRREDRRWKREVLEQTMVSLFEASLGYVDQAALRAAQDNEDLSEYKERALDAHSMQLRALTRLRFLANADVLKCAFKLHGIEDQLYSIVFTKPLDSADWEELEDQQRKVRAELFNACRRNLGLEDVVDEGDPAHPGTSSSSPVDDLVTVDDLKRGIGPSAQDRVKHEMKRQRQEREARSARSDGA
jgi:hypothetical protein